jgi:predicted RNase H-like nuclease
MEISGEIHYANVEIDFDVDYLAEALATNHSFVDDVVMHNYVDEHMDGAIEQIDSVVLDVDELREQIRELSPDNNYVRINDLHTTIKEVVDARLVELFTKLIKES